MSNNDRRIFLLEKRIELMELYQAELFRYVFANDPEPRNLAMKVEPRNLAMKVRRFILPYFSVIDRRLVKYRRYNQFRRWIYKK